MKAILIFIAGMMLASLLKAQVLIKGTVKDNKGRILAGANIAIKDSYDGTMSDSTGSFSFKTTEKGNALLVASNIGYKTMELPVVLRTDSVVISFNLKEEINELKAVIITAGSYEASDKKKGTVLKALDIATTAGANADISATIQTLPVSQRGRFSPFLFSGTVFSSGGYSALYGQALSSVLSLESLDIPEKSELQVGLSPLFATVGLQQVANNKKSSYGFSYNWTNLAVYQKLVPQAPDFFKVPDFHTADMNYRFKTKKNGVFKVYAYYNAGALGVRNPSLDSVGLWNAFSLKNQNLFTNLSFRQFLGNGWKINIAASVSYNKDEILTQVQNQQYQAVPLTNIAVIDQTNFSLNAHQWMLQGRIVVDKRFGAINTIRFGTEVWNNADSSRFQSVNGFFPSSINDFYKAGFAEADLYITNELAFRPGVRIEHSSLLNKMNIAPRAALSYKLGRNSQFTADYGIFYQTPERRYLINQPPVDFLRADHYILTYQHISSSYTFRAQAFYKDYVSLLKTSNSFPTNVSNNGLGYAKGIELFWRDKKTFKNFDYWISYSYLDTKRDYNNYTALVQPTFAATHSGSVVLKKFWVKNMFGVNWSYNWSTGRPYFNPNRSSKEFLSDKTIGYSSNNFSLNWLPKIGKANAVVVLGVNNVFNERQIFGYNYSGRLRDTNGELIRSEVNPPADRSFFLGIFLSWGVDRSQQNINNNL